MGQLIYLKTGDRAPSATADLNADLTGATVIFRMANADGSKKVSGSATVTDAVQGLVEYAWGATDTTVAGAYIGEFVVTFAGGLEQTFPQGSFLGVIIRDSVPSP